MHDRWTRRYLDHPSPSATTENTTNTTTTQEQHMAIALDEPRPTGYPVVKRVRIGETFTGAIINYERRDIMKRDPATGVLGPVPKGGGKNKQELVVTLVTLPGTTATAGLGDEVGVPAPGDVVRFIARGKSYGEWIEQANALKTLNVGDILTHVTDSAQCYDADGGVKGPKITTQAALDAVPRATAVGVYGALTLGRGDPASQWTAQAEAAHKAAKEAKRIPLDAVEMF